MKSTRTRLMELSDWYDRHRPEIKRIRVNVTRRTAMRSARPKERGGPLFYREREVITKPVEVKVD
jgi:hypothetical protein